MALSPRRDRGTLCVAAFACATQIPSDHALPSAQLVLEDIGAVNDIAVDMRGGIYWSTCHGDDDGVWSYDERTKVRSRLSGSLECPRVVGATAAGVLYLAQGRLVYVSRDFSFTLATRVDRFLCASSSAVYVQIDRQLHAISLSSGRTRSVPIPFFFAIAADDEHIVWADHDNSPMHAMHVATGRIWDIAVGHDVDAITLSHSFVYFSGLEAEREDTMLGASNERSIWAAPVGGGPAALVARDQEATGALVSDLYGVSWINSDSREALHGTVGAGAYVLGRAQLPFVVGATGARIYWTEATDSNSPGRVDVVRALLPGG